MGYVSGIRWNDKMIINKIHEVMRVLNVDRMPTASETNLVLRNSTLSNKIAKTGGFNLWASKLGLKIKDSETQLGHDFEVIATKLLNELGYSTQRMSVKYPFDILVNDKISIDVKVGREYISCGSKVHTIGINKKYATCDLYIIFALDEKERIERTFIIPGCDLKVTTMNFGNESIYNKYIDRWDLIKSFDTFYKQLA